MKRAELHQLWATVKNHFTTAEKEVPNSLKSDMLFKEYKHFLLHNELGLALEYFESFLDKNDFENKETVRKHCKKIQELMS